jgi:pimeloyl-ACP methyl ester carboxylesterase
MPLAHTMYYSESHEARFVNDADSRRPALILVHAAGYDHRSWPMEIRRMSGWRVLAVDLPGHGRSEGRSRQSVSAYAQDLLAFLDELELYRVVLVGHSLGASIALQLALDQPELLVGLGLIAASAHLEVPATLVDYFSNPLTIPLGIQLYKQWAFSPQTNPALIETGLEALRTVRPAVLAGDWQAVASFDLNPQSTGGFADLAGITAPAWVAIGGDDRLAPLPCAHYLASCLPAAHIQVVPNAGHMLPLEQPVVLAAGLRQFLDSLSPVELKRQPNRAQVRIQKSTY